jgi:hypothetical protein
MNMTQTAASLVAATALTLPKLFGADAQIVPANEVGRLAFTGITGNTFELAYTPTPKDKYLTIRPNLVGPVAASVVLPANSDMVSVPVLGDGLVLFQLAGTQPAIPAATSKTLTIDLNGNGTATLTPAPGAEGQPLYSAAQVNGTYTFEGFLAGSYTVPVGDAPKFFKLGTPQ